MSDSISVPNPSRRRFLRQTAVGAAVFMLGAYIPLVRRAAAQEAGGVPQGIFDPNVFLKITPDGIVTLISKKFEMGQGITTGLATLVAEELDVAWANMRFEFAPNNAKLYNNLVFGPVMATGGTTSMLEAYEQMRQVGAAARSMFVSAAAAKWNVAASGISIVDGIVAEKASGKRAPLGELVADAMKQPVPNKVTLKDPKDWKLIGTHVPRLDSAMKTNGSAQFGIDARRPGMLTAVVQRPLQFGATVASFDAAETRKINGVVNVVQVPQGVAVIAKDTWSAIRGRDALSIEWDTSKAEMRSSDAILAEYRTLSAKPGLTALKRGDASTRLAGAAHTVEAEFTFPYLAHTPMEPLSALIEVKDGRAETWMGSQLQSLDTPAIAEALGLTPDAVHINTLLGGGSFGRRGSTMADWARELGDVAKAAGGTAPIHLIWTREDDIRGGFYRPMALHKVRAGVDAKGRIAGWLHTTVSKSIFTGTPFEAMSVKEGLDASAVEGIVDTPYAIDDFAVDVHMAKSPVPVLWYRSVGHSHTAHVMETVIDELAHLAGKDPLAFRMNLLSAQPRDAAVLKLAGEKAGWGRPMGKNRGRGVAYHPSFGTRVAMVAEVTMVDGVIKVDRIVAAVDLGIAVNPDVIAAQVEGAVGFALSVPLRNQLTLKDGKVEQSNFHDYQVTRMREMPKVEVHIINSTERPTGIGEPGVSPVAPAIGNAIFSATGKRFRSLPFDLSTLGDPNAKRTR